MKTPVGLLQAAQIRLRRIEKRQRRYPQDLRLHCLQREAAFRVAELEAYVVALGSLTATPTPKRSRTGHAVGTRKEAPARRPGRAKYAKSRCGS